MKVFRYFGPLLLLCLTREILHVACKTKTQKRYDHVKRLRKDSVSYSQRTKDVSENHFKRKKIPHGNNQEGPFSDGPQKGQRIFKTNFTIHNKPDLHIIGKAGYKSTKSSAKDRANSARSDTTQNHLANKISNLKPHKRTKPNDSHAKKNAKKKTMVKKYSLFQSTSPVQSDSEYQPIMGGGQDFIMGNDQQGDVRDQGFSLEGQQQQAMISATNPLSQYDTGQDGQGQDAVGYQQENNQPSTANFADSNYNEDAGERDGGQLSSLGQAIQFQQAGYSQQPRQQEPDEESMSQDSQGGELAGQGSQLMDAGQLQYQGEQAGQGQDQGAQEQGDQEQNDQDQTVSPNGFEQASFQQQEPQEDEQQQQPQGFEQQQQPQGFEQQQQLQDQTQEFQQQQEGPQQIQSDEQQGPEGIPTESQGLASSPNSYESLLGADGRQTGDSGQQGQGTVGYASEQSLGGSNKMAPPPGIQYASSIEEALKEPSEPTQQSQEFNSQEGDGQGGQSTNDGATSINIGPGTEAKEGGNNGLMGVGGISAPGGYQTSTVDDNGNPINPEAENGINGYASMNGQATNGETNQYEENAQPQSSPSENQNGLGVPQEQFLAPGAEPKVPPLEDDVYKIINIANKNGPTAVKGCKGCPPHARCIDKVCIINDDQPLAHILSALSGPESDEESSPNACKDECHYNAKCINRECMCKAGYTGDGLDCRPDTCLPGCKQHGKCIKGFCVCDHSHYFNGYECAPYTITHKNCPLQCSATCHAGCPPNCCKHHPAMKLHNNDGNPQQMTPPPNGLSSKPKVSPRPTEVVLKPIVKVGEALTNFASDFQHRPGESDAAGLEAVTVNDPTGGFAVSDTDAKPLLGEEGCPGQCKSECRDTCPVRCCLGKCPFSCAEKCEPSCPKPCCYVDGTKNQFPMMDPRIQETFMKTMAERFCPRACRSKCDAKCPPICCERNSSSATLTDANFQHLKSESKNGADFFRNAMSWFGMMNFLNMMYSMYGNLYNPKHKHSPWKSDDHKLKTAHPTKSKKVVQQNRITFKDVGVAEKLNDKTPQCPGYCDKTCLPPCPPNCCHNKVNETKSSQVTPTSKCPPSCSWFCSNSCPVYCCSKDKKPLVLEHNATEPVKAANRASAAPPQASPPKPPSACTASCPAYCYPHCLENCCLRGEMPTIKPAAAHVQAKQSYDNFFSKKPTPSSNQACPSICENSCAPSCPVRCCAGILSSLPPSAKSPAKIKAPLCPGGCLSECFPACTISCCTTAPKKLNSDMRGPTENPTRRHDQPHPKALSFPLPPPIALCHPGCPRSCYPNCDETCCKASSDHASSLERPGQAGDSTQFTIKVPCPMECRPFNCLYYCHHDCCLRGKQPMDQKRNRYQALRLEQKMKYINGMRKKKTLDSRFKNMHVPLDKRSGVGSGTRG